MIWRKGTGIYIYIRDVSRNKCKGKNVKKVFKQQICTSEKAILCLPASQVDPLQSAGRNGPTTLHTIIVAGLVAVVRDFIAEFARAAKRRRKKKYWWIVLIHKNISQSQIVPLHSCYTDLAMAQAGYNCVQAWGMCPPTSRMRVMLPDTSCPSAVGMWQAGRQPSGGEDYISSGLSSEVSYGRSK